MEKSLKISAVKLGFWIIKILADREGAFTPDRVRSIDLNCLREAWLNPPDPIRIKPEIVPGYPDRVLPKDEEAARVLKKRMPTNLYNERCAWLDNAHRALDAAVAAAYGWPADLSRQRDPRPALRAQTGAGGSGTVIRHASIGGVTIGLGNDRIPNLTDGDLCPSRLVLFGRNGLDRFQRMTRPVQARLIREVSAHSAFAGVSVVSGRGAICASVSYAPSTNPEIRP